MQLHLNKGNITNCEEYCTIINQRLLCAKLVNDIDDKA